MRLALAALLALAAAPASACMFTPREGAEPQLQRGERGAQLWLWGGTMESSLSAAEDLGGGFVVQTTYVGAGCGGETSHVIQDCRTGEAVAVGGTTYFPEEPVQWQRQLALRQALVARLEYAHPVSIADVTAMARTEGLDFAVPMRTDSTLRLGEVEVTLGDACRAFYPGRPGTP